MKKVIAAISSLIYLVEMAFCIFSIIEFGIVKNFAILWIIPFTIQFVCYMVIFFKKTLPVKVAVFVTVFGFVLLLPSLFSLPEILYWNLPIVVSTVLSLIFLCLKKKSRQF